MRASFSIDYLLTTKANVHAIVTVLFEHHVYEDAFTGEDKVEWLIHWQHGTCGYEDCRPFDGTTKVGVFRDYAGRIAEELGCKVSYLGIQSVM